MICGKYLEKPCGALKASILKADVCIARRTNHHGSSRARSNPAIFGSYILATWDVTVGVSIILSL